MFQEPSIAQSGSSTYADWNGARRERPWLLPSNRKLRHLEGICLRNLTLSQPASRSRGKTIDDESLPYAFKSPTKLFAQRETHKLEHSRSSSDIKSPPPKDAYSRKESLNGAADALVETRPPIGRLRRRSTLNWIQASPGVRQKKLEDVTGRRMADTWFSLHCKGVDEPVYVSETVERAMNPDFRFFDIHAWGPLVTCADEVTVRFWAKTEHMNDYRLLIELDLHLGSLQFIGKSLESFHHPLPSNCIVFYLSDGVYTSFTDLPSQELAPSPLNPWRGIGHNVQPTPSFDALMRLSNLDDCIQDALATREKLTSQISSILQENQESLNTINEASQSKESLASVQRAVTVERKQLRAATTRRRELQASLQVRRQAMHEGAETQQKAQVYLSGAQSKLNECHGLISSNHDEIRGQIQRICEDISQIYPIDPVAHKPLRFTIRALPLPNSNYSDTTADDDAAIDAALGFVSHLVYLLSFYLSAPLPYPIQPYASQSFIKDPISILPPTQRTFPLHRKSSLAYRFDYAVFLLNKDIELLMAKRGLKVLDVRHTLPNLKYLLYVLTAGRNEVPGRKAGGVRGLWGGRGGVETPMSTSRSESQDSVRVGEQSRIRTILENGEKGKGKDASLSASSLKTGTLTATGLGVSS